MFDISEIIKSAMALGIKLTHADVGSELCNAWADRVALAQMHFERGEMEACHQHSEGDGRHIGRTDADVRVRQRCRST